MPKKEKEKEEKAMTPASSNLPDFLRDKKGTGRGRENIDKADLILPRIKLIQALSPEVEKGSKAGEMINSLTLENYGSEIIIIPIVHFKSRIYWKEREEGGGMLCSAPDALNPSRSEYAVKCTECTIKDWDNKAKTSKEKAPKCVIYYNFAVLVNDCPTPVALSMEKTKIRVARKLISLASYTGGNLDMFAKKYKIKIEKVSNDKGVWDNFTVTPAGYVTEDEFKRAEIVYESLKGLALSVEQEKPEE